MIWLNDSVVEIQILFLFCKLSCVLNLIKPGQRIVLRKHLPPAVCLYFHIIGEVPGEDKELKLQKDKNAELQKDKNAELQKEKKARLQNYRKTEDNKTDYHIISKGSGESWSLIKYLQLTKEKIN